MTRLFEVKPFIIAEVGSNWRTLNDCIQSIGQAKAVGADAVKFQLFTRLALYGVMDVAPNDPRTQLFGRLHHIDKQGDCPYLDPAWLPALKEKADACGIELMCTAFSPELVAAVDPFVSVHKVASSDLSYPQLLEAVARTRKPMLLSTGASSEGDIAAALWCFDNVVPDDERASAMMLYCVAAYPAGFIDFEVMKKFDGFSDHTLGITAAVQAARQGAKVIEKHFTAFPDLDTPDRPHSLTVDDFRTMVEYIRGVRQSKIGPTPEERDMLLRHNRRLIATQDVHPGEDLIYGRQFGAYRSLEDDTRGLSPFAWRDVEGKVATVEIKRGKGIGPGDFE